MEDSYYLLLITPHLNPCPCGCFIQGGVIRCHWHLWCLQWRPPLSLYVVLCYVQFFLGWWRPLQVEELAVVVALRSYYFRP